MSTVRSTGLVGRVAVTLAAVVLLLSGAAVLVAKAGIDLNPFDEQRTDRSQPPLLQSIEDLARFQAAEGNFQVVIDLEDQRRYVPDFLLNERTLFVAVGSVDAYVELGDLDDDAVEVTGEAVTLTLPRPQLDDPNLDVEKSYVFADERGLLNRLGEVFGQDSQQQQDVYALANRRLARAAQETELLDRAEQNTRQTLTGLVNALGYTDVTIEFTEPDPDPSR